MRCGFLFLKNKKNYLIAGNVRTNVVPSAGCYEKALNTIEILLSKGIIELTGEEKEKNLTPYLWQ